MRRRDFISAGALTAAWTLSSAPGRGQQPTKSYRIAFVLSPTPVSKITEADHPVYRAFVDELRRLGYAEGRNLTIQRYSGEGRPERFPQLAREVVSSEPDLIIAATEGLAKAFKAATASIPIVASSGDPVAAGLASSLARPGGNITGTFVTPGPEIAEKYFEVLKEIEPTISRVGFLTTVSLRPEDWRAALRHRVADRFGITIVGPPLASPELEPEYRYVIAAMVQEGVDALVIDAVTPNYSHNALIVSLIDAHRLPSISGWAEYARAGGLASYAVDLEQTFRQMAGYVDRLLRGERASDLPFQGPTGLNLTINLKAAAALGQTVPPSILASADKVIE